MSATVLHAAFGKRVKRLRTWRECPGGFTCNGCGAAGASPQSSLNASAAEPQREARQ